MGSFDNYGKYYNLLYEDKDYAAETKYVIDLLSRYGREVKELLEFGCGTGKHGQLLADSGYQVLGIESSKTMLAAAVEAEGLEIRLGDIREIHLERVFDAVLSLFHVLSYQLTDDDVQATYDRAAEHLESGGLFIVDFWYTPSVCAQGPEVRVKRVSDSDVELTRIAEPKLVEGKNQVDVHYTIFARDLAAGNITTMSEVHSMRHFNLAETNAFAEKAGFEQIVCEEFMSGKEPGVDTWTVCVVNRKR